MPVRINREEFLPIKKINLLESIKNLQEDIDTFERLISEYERRLETLESENEELREKIRTEIKN